LLINNININIMDMERHCVNFFLISMLVSIGKKMR
jgi:hypothetical protein